MRGEYDRVECGIDLDEELPPRARRIPQVAITVVWEGGTTSACAENTPQDRDGEQRYGNYLRVRGEYINFHLVHIKQAELPPRARRIH